MPRAHSLSYLALNSTPARVICHMSFVVGGVEGFGGDSGGLVFVVCGNTLGSRGRRNSRTFISPNHDFLENHPIGRNTDLENISSPNILFERSSLAFCSSLTIRSGSREIASYAICLRLFY